MPEKVMPGPVQDTACIREAVCIHTKKIYDSCKDKDCIEDLRFYPSQPRCPYCADKCRSEVPELKEIAPGHLCACHYPL